LKCKCYTQWLHVRDAGEQQKPKFFVYYRLN
jgi:hypothetical protein